MSALHVGDEHSGRRAPLGGWGSSALGAALGNARRLLDTERERAAEDAAAAAEARRTKNPTQADLLAAMLREFPAWARTHVAVPHLMKFIRSCVDEGLCSMRYDVVAFRRDDGSPVLVATITGDGADGEITRRIDLHGVYGVVRDVEMAMPAGVATGRGPVELTSEATARDFAGISVPKDARTVSRGGAEARRDGGDDTTGTTSGAGALGVRP